MQYSNAMKINIRLLKCNYQFLMPPHVHSTSRVLVIWAQIILQNRVFQISTKGNYLISAGLNESESLNSQKSLWQPTVILVLWFGQVHCLTQLITGSETLYYNLYMFTVSLEIVADFNLILTCSAYCQHHTLLQIDFFLFSVNERSLLLKIHLFAFSVRS